VGQIQLLECDRSSQFHFLQTYVLYSVI